MFQMPFRVLMAVVWLAVGLGLLGSVLFHAEWVAGRDAGRLTLIGLLALGGAAYNVLRVVFQIRHRRQVPTPPNPLRQPPPVAPREYIPELDFNRNEPPEGERPV